MASELGLWRHQVSTVRMTGAAADCPSAVSTSVAGTPVCILVFFTPWTVLGISTG